MTLENDCLAILSFASTRATWVSTSSCAAKCGLPFQTVHSLLDRNEFIGFAEYYRYDFRIRQRVEPAPKGKYRRTLYISAVSRGYA